MGKIFKKAISILLVLALAACVPMVASSVNEEGTRFYGVYTSNMLFAQNQPIIFAGRSEAGTVAVEMEKGGELIGRDEVSLAAPGEFKLTLEALAGGYDEYSVTLYYNNAAVQTLNNVVIGELWLASGQSNMQYGLLYTHRGYELTTTDTCDKNIRALLAPPTPAYNGSEGNLALNNQTDIPGAYWDSGDNAEAFKNVSAVAYFFAEQLRTSLDVPVGILNVSLGGSSIYTWLSRETIENDAAIKGYLESAGRYIPAEGFETREKMNPYVDMTANYTKKIAPLFNFRPAGMIWYQGESDISNERGSYSLAFNAMQEDYSKQFGFGDADMPFVYTDIACFDYTSVAARYGMVADLNMEFSDFAASKPESRAVTTLYEVGLNWDLNEIAENLGYVGSIHPLLKEPIGAKLAHAALGLVYDKNDTYSAPYLKDSYIRDGSVYAVIEGVGDGLAVRPVDTGYSYDEADAGLYGFSIAGKDGIYYEAKAEIVSADTVRIYSDSVPSPRSAAYAYSAVNFYSNLFATDNGEFVFGVSPFITANLDGAKYVQDKYWSTCELAKAWRFTKETDLLDTWRVDKGEAAISYNTADKVAGTASLQLDLAPSGTKKSFSFGPVLSSIQKSASEDSFTGIDRNYTNYGTMSFYVKNTSDKSMELKSVRFKNSDSIWYSPAVKGSESVSYTIPADGEWHMVTYNLNELYFDGVNGGVVRDNGVLDNVFDISFELDADSAGTLLVDEFTFGAEAAGGFDDITFADYFLKLVPFLALIEKLLAMLPGVIN